MSKKLETNAFSQDTHDKNFFSRLTTALVYRMPYFFQPKNFTSLPMNKRLLSKRGETNEMTR